MKYQVAVIGGGPAGMMAAGRAGELGAKVVLVEKNKKLGVKLRLTGKGRCNITANIGSLKDLVKKYGHNGKFLFSAFNVFGVDDVIGFFESRNLKTKVERGERVFPLSDRSADVLDVLIKYLQDGGVKVKTDSPVKNIVCKNNKILKIILQNSEEIIADKYIVATGGKSYPATGSDGIGYEWLKEMGHHITRLSPALSPIIVREKWVEELEGLSLKNVQINVFSKGKKQFFRFGEALFTANGLSGPIILDMSKEIGRLLNNEVVLKIDFKPALEFRRLDHRIQRDFVKYGNKMFKNSLVQLLPQKLIPVIIKLSGINPETKVNLIKKEQRKFLVRLLKEFTLVVKRVSGYDRAIVTAGGVNLQEIDPQTMKSKIVDNLYIVGEILDLDGPTGGFNLQSCWSSGYLAGNSAGML